MIKTSYAQEEDEEQAASDPNTQNGTEDPDQLFNELLKKYSNAVCTSQKLETVPIPKRKGLMGKWMREGDLGFVYGERGSGKTWFIDAIATHLSTGNGLHDWMVLEPVNVLLIDGEMPLDAARDRLKGMMPDNPRLHILHHEMLFDRSGVAMNLTNERAQRVITEICKRHSIKLLVLDNLSCLFYGVKENDADDWEKVLNWLLELRRRHIAVLIVHHTGVSGERMRGTTRREDAAFWIIKVEKLEGHAEQEKGTRFETTFTKQRNSDTREWTRKWSFKTEKDGQISIGCEEVSFDEKVLGLIQDGLSSATDISNELGCAKSTVCKAAQRLEGKKLIERHGRTGYKPRAFMSGDES